MLVLCDFFTYFRKIAMNNYSLDPCHYYTLPGLSMSACLKYTGVQLQLLTDINQLLFVEKAIRGGISQISNRYAKANNKYLPDYNPSEPSSYIMYLDANNLYGHAMTQKLPISNFKFLNKKELQEFDINSAHPDGEMGYIIECDLIYDSSSHDYTNDLPLAPEHLEVTPDMLSEAALDLLQKLNKKQSPKQTKLIPNLQDKRNYITHYRNLQFLPVSRNETVKNPQNPTIQTRGLDISVHRIQLPKTS